MSRIDDSRLLSICKAMNITPRDGYLNNPEVPEGKAALLKIKAERKLDRKIDRLEQKLEKTELKLENRLSKAERHFEKQNDS